MTGLRTSPLLIPSASKHSMAILKTIAIFCLVYLTWGRPTTSDEKNVPTKADELHRRRNGQLVNLSVFHPVVNDADFPAAIRVIDIGGLSEAEQRIARFRIPEALSSLLRDWPNFPPPVLIFLGHDTTQCPTNTGESSLRPVVLNFSGIRDGLLLHLDVERAPPLNQDEQNRLAEFQTGEPNGPYGIILTQQIGQEIQSGMTHGVYYLIEQVENAPDQIYRLQWYLGTPDPNTCPPPPDNTNLDIADILDELDDHNFCQAHGCGTMDFITGST